MEYNLPRKLKADEVELRIGSKTKDKTKVQLLVYKDARTDMALLDEMFGNNWQVEYKEIKGVMYCGIGVLVGDHWVWRWNAGVESKGTGDDDPNNQKGEASDAFKRAGFLWGIGRELYKLKGIQWIPIKDNYDKWFITELDWDEDTLWNLIIINQDDEIVYQIKKGKKIFIKEGTKQADTRNNEPTPNNVKPERENVASEPTSAEKETVIDAADVVVKKNTAIYKELLTSVFDLLDTIHYPSADVKAKEIVKSFFEKQLNVAPIKSLNDKIELTNDKTQLEPLIKNRILLQKDDIWLGDNGQPSLKFETEQEMNIWEMENI
ncbi:MAG: hypothetical protein M0R51_16385 [Clostridia bacterium]|jgi:hypothetical protein|nr:hypothetical protein [Clostridia bacterium]